MMWMKPFVDFAHVIYLASVSASAFIELLQSKTEAIFLFVAGWKAVSEKGLSIYFSLALPLTVLRSPLFVSAACAGISIASLRHISAVHEQYREGNLDVIRIFGFNDSRRTYFRTSFAYIYFALPSRYAELWFLLHSQRKLYLKITL